MMPVDKWYEYRYTREKDALDMKPKAVRPTVSEPKSATVTRREKVTVVSLLLLIGVLCVCLIVSTAYVAGVKYEINTIARESAELQGEIENLNVKIKNATNIKAVEEKAINDLGMIYPSSEQFVFLSAHSKPQGDFAMLLKDQAYN
jgi:cell division protein FtsL